MKTISFFMFIFLFSVEIIVFFLLKFIL